MSENNQLFKVLDEYIYFESALQAQEYAKEHPGKAVVRNSDVYEERTPVQKVLKTPKMDKTPKMILEYLNKHIISQDAAKKEIALAMYYHSVNTKYFYNKDIGTNGPVMIIGPTGSGKTFIVQKACEYLDVLFLHVDTACMVPEGIQGYSVNNLMQDLLYLADNNMHKAAKAVVFLDEIDKLFSEDGDLDYGLRVASQLLRLLEGGVFKVYDTKNKEKESIDFNTRNIQFILGGAFQHILDEKKSKKPSIGFADKTEEHSTQEISLEDLYKTTVPKELLGRMNSIINLHSLTEDDYYEILTNSESSPLQEFVNKITFHGDRVDISEETLHEVAKRAATSELGVRSIKQTLKSVFNDALFETPGGEYTTHSISIQSSSKGLL